MWRKWFSSARLKELMEEYGWVFLGTYLGIFVVVLAGFAVAIQMGFEPENAGESAGTIFAAWLATKATQPFRIAAALVMTPIAARVLRRGPVQPAVAETDIASELGTVPSSDH